MILSHYLERDVDIRPLVLRQLIPALLGKLVANQERLCSDRVGG
jgi:hypothetical protein